MQNDDGSARLFWRQMVDAETELEELNSQYAELLRAHPKMPAKLQQTKEMLDFYCGHLQRLTQQFPAVQFEVA